MSEAPIVMSPDSAWLIESMDDGLSYAIRSSRVVIRFRSAYQEVEVHDSPSLGRLLRLGGAFTTSERDEFFYHENLVHVPACAHPNPSHALIVGGGDGGAAEELLKHATIRQVTLVEIDEAVIDVARKYLGGVHHGVIDIEGGDPRLSVRVCDGLQHVRNDDALYDVIILDLTDSGGPSQPLYSRAFYLACATRLKPDGILSLHVASPFVHPDRIVRTLTNLKQAFDIVRPFLVTVPLSGGAWMMASASQRLDPAEITGSEIDARLRWRGVKSLHYYNGRMHHAAMALPNFVSRAIAGTGVRGD